MPSARRVFATAALLSLTAVATACTQHTDGTCIWVPGDDGSCGSRNGDSGGGGGSPPQREFVRYPSATVVSTGAATFLFALERDDRTDDAILVGAMRAGGLPATFEPWVVDVEHPTALAGWSEQGRGLLAVTDATGTRAIELDDAGNPTSVTYVERFVDAAFDGATWWLLDAKQRELGITALGGQRRSFVTLESTILALPQIERGTDGSPVVAWGQRNATWETIYLARVDGDAVPIHTAPAREPATRLVPGRDELWLRGVVIRFDPTTLAEVARTATEQAPPHAILPIPGGFLGWDKVWIKAYDPALLTGRLVGGVRGDITGAATYGANAVVIQDDDTIVATLYEDGESDAITVLETTEYTGCSAGGASGLGALALVGLALLRSRRAHPARPARRIAR